MFAQIMWSRLVGRQKILERLKLQAAAPPVAPPHLALAVPKDPPEVPPVVPPTPDARLEQLKAAGSRLTVGFWSLVAKMKQ